MDYLGGLLSGFSGRKAEIEQQTREEAQRASDREGHVYEALLNSPDEETRHLATAGLLHSAEPRQRKSGLAGWLGEMQQSPYLPAIRALSPTVETQEPNLPATTTTGYLSTPPARTGSLAQPATSPTEVGAPPPTPVESATRVTTTAPATHPVSRPRQVFPDPIETYRRQQIAKAGADIEGDVEAYTPYLGREGAVQQVLKERNAKRAGGLGISHVAVELPDGTQRLAMFDARRQQYVDPDTQETIPGAKPLSHTGSTSLGADREAVARELYGKRATELSEPQMAHVNAVSFQRKGQLTPSQALSAASRMLPNATVQQQTDLADALAAGTAVQPVGGAPASVGQPPPVAAPVSSTTPTATPTTPAPGAPPPAPAKTGVGAQVPPALTSATHETGKPLPPQVFSLRSRAEATNKLVDAALAALEPYKADNNPASTFQLATKYRQGVYDPVASAAAQLADLAGLQASAQAQLTSGASRALRYYIDRRQHVPILPSPRQVEAKRLGVPTKVVGSATRLLTNEGSPDSPMAMYQKLRAVRDNNQNFIDSLDEAVGMTKAGGVGTTVGAPPPGGPATAPAAPQAYKDANGVWRIRQ